MLGCQLTCCCTPSPPATPSGSTRKFFESLDPMNGFKDRDDFETYLYNQSYKIEPKPPNKMEMVDPRRPPECLKSPGIKPPKSHNSNTMNSTRHHRSRSRMSEQKSSPTIGNSTPQSAPIFAPWTNSPFSAEQDFGIVEINPGHAPRYIGDSGRVNQAFSVDTPLATPALGLPPLPRTPTSPKIPSTLLRDNAQHFLFPPSGKPPAPPPSSEPKLVLQNPPLSRRAHKPPAPPPTPSSSTASSSADAQPPPLLPRKPKVLSAPQISPLEECRSPDAVNIRPPEICTDEVADETEMSGKTREASPSVPPRVSATGKYLPPPLNTHELAKLIDNRSASPNIEHQLWYFGEIDRPTANQLLSGTSGGTFLVRYSPKQKQYVLSLSYAGKNHHIQIAKKGCTHEYYIHGSKTFKTVAELVKYYKTKNLIDIFDGLNTTLGFPLLKDGDSRKLGHGLQELLF